MPMFVCTVRPINLKQMTLDSMLVHADPQVKFQGQGHTGIGRSLQQSSHSNYGTDRLYHFSLMSPRKGYTESAELS